MSSTVDALRRASRAAIGLPVAAGIVASLLTVVLQRRGIVLSPDGWAYWEGSLSLLRGEGFRYFGGQPITLWPPGFSLYLALWQGLLGNSARTLAIAHAAATGVAAGLWVACAERLAGRRALTFRGSALALVVSLALPIASRAIQSESLFMALFGGAVLVAVCGGSGDLADTVRAGREAGRALLFALLLAALVLTRLAGAAFVPALAWLFWCSASGRPTTRRNLALAWAGAVIAVAALGWASLDRMLVHAHIELDATAPSRIAEILGGNLVAAWRIALPSSAIGAAATAIVCALILAGLRASGWPPSAQLPSPEGRTRSGLPLATALAALCSSALFALYGVTGTRFVLPIVALLVLLLAEQAERAAGPGGRRLATAILAGLALVEVARAGFWIHYSLTDSRRGIRLDKRLVAACAPENPECRLAPDEIAPHDYPWIDRGFGERASRGASDP